MEQPGQELKLALVQMNGAGTRDENVGKACALIDRAVAQDKPHLVVLPEFFNTPYVFQYRDYKHMDWAERDDGPTITAMREKARTHGIHLVATIFEEEGAGVYYDTAVLIGPDGAIRGKYRKVHPAAVKSLEKIYFRYGSRFPVFRVGDWRLGLIICYDTTFPESARCATVNGAELILAPYAAPPLLFWREMMVTRAAENGVYFAPCNKVGQEGEWTFGGRSLVVSPRGHVLTEAGADEEQIVSAVLNRDEVFQARRDRPNLRDRRPELYTPLCTATEDIPPLP
jgi:N-carbamoylputrescine amidase